MSRSKSVQEDSESLEEDDLQQKMMTGLINYYSKLVILQSLGSQSSALLFLECSAVTGFQEKQALAMHSLLKDSKVFYVIM